MQVVFHRFAEFSIYFDGGVEFPSEPYRSRAIGHRGARGRLHMSPEARYAYPDDEAVALRWLEHGI